MTTIETHCRRCHRAIRSPASINHGFGPVCWQKLNALDYNERPMMFRITITDKQKASESLNQIREAFTKFIAGSKLTCRNCGEPLHAGNIEYYDHQGGYNLPGFGVPQWLYHHCQKCNHDLSLWKLRIPDLKGDLNV